MNQATMTETTIPLPAHKDVLTDLLRLGAQRLLAQAIQAEVDDYLAARRDVRDEAGRSWSSVTAPCPSGPSTPASAPSK